MSKLTAVEEIMVPKMDFVKTLPNTIIFGAMRAGTTSLFRYLSDHPDVYTSPKKELNIFYDLLDGSSNEIADKYNAYLGKQLYAKKIVLDASPIYARKSGDISKKIKSVIPAAKIIFFLRDPAERSLSIFKAIDRSGAFKARIGFDQFVETMIRPEPNLDIFADLENGKGIALEFVQVGFYSRVLNNLLENFGAQQLHVGFLEDLSSRPLKEIQRLCLYLGIDPGFYENYTFTVENPAIQTRWPRLYAFALGVNAGLEPVLNRVPSVRKMIRGAHHKINVAQGDDKTQAYVRAAELLKDYYRSDKKPLLDILRRLNIAETPVWVTR